MRDNKQSRSSPKRAPIPLDERKLRELALSYVARFATSSGKLERYLRRKLRERGWEGEGEPDLARLGADFAERGYLDDESYARSRSADLLRRGYGARRVNEALGQAGIAEPLRDAAAPGIAAARHAALRLAEKRRFGPFAAQAPDPARREKQLAAMLRAGHPLDIARNLVDAPSEQEAREWAGEYDDEVDDDFAA